MIHNKRAVVTNKILTYPCTLLPLPKGTRCLVGGCFDLLHYGHLSFFKAAKQQADYLIVCLEPDATIIRTKGAAPIHNQTQRAEILAELRSIDLILLLPCLQTYEDYLRLVKTVNPQCLAVTEGDPQFQNKQRQAKEIGAEVLVVNKLVEGLSSSLIRRQHL